tara:strand:+ start:740 stop:940 length:201 start_codon:yes stop_codon:yes gene_type:complete
MSRIHLNNIAIDYKKVYKVIWSCQCEEHLDVAGKLITYFYKKHDNQILSERLKSKLSLKRKKIRTK